MKVVDNTAKMTTFKNINVGGVFRYKSIFYMRTLLVFDNDNSDLANAVAIKDGDWTMFDNEDEVEVINAELTIKESE